MREEEGSRSRIHHSLLKVSSSIDRDDGEGFERFSDQSCPIAGEAESNHEQIPLH